MQAVWSCAVLPRRQHWLFGAADRPSCVRLQALQESEGSQMTPREPDRFEARCGVHGQRPGGRDGHCICPELRAAESSALERGAQVADRYKSRLIPNSIRALIPPAAAPAAE